jgi:DNA-binding transcriptional regulator YiaG
MMDETTIPTPYEELISVIELLPELVREKRRRDRLSYAVAAKQIGLSTPTLYNFENRKGQGTAHANTLLAVLRWVG